MNIPEVHSLWKHKGNGINYEVILIANEYSENEDYPIVVVYIGSNGRTWAKNLDNFLEKMVKFEDC